MRPYNVSEGVAEAYEEAAGGEFRIVVLVHVQQPHVVAAENGEMHVSEVHPEGGADVHGL